MRSHILLLILSLILTGLLTSGCSDNSVPASKQVESTITQNPSGINITWVEKYMTYEQDDAGELRQTDNIFLAEVGYTDGEAIKSHTAKIFIEGVAEPLAIYDASDLLSFTNGFIYSRKSESFDTLADLETKHAQAANYVWQVAGPDGKVELQPMRIGGPEGQTEIPDLTSINVMQNGASVSDLSSVDPNADINFSWGEFSEGAVLEGSDWVDLHFLLVDNCHGEFVYTGGAPGGEVDVVTDYSVTSSDMPAAKLEAGMDYVVFLSRVNFRDFNMEGIVQQLAANSFAVELRFRTSGETTVDRRCPDPHWRADYRFSRKSKAGEGMVAWPTVQEIARRQN